MLSLPARPAPFARSLAVLVSSIQRCGARLIAGFVLVVFLFFFSSSSVLAQAAGTTLPPNTWQPDEEVTSVGKSAVRARDFFDWTINPANQNWVFVNPSTGEVQGGVNNLAEFWQVIRNIAYLLTLLVVLVMAIMLIITRGRDFHLRRQVLVIGAVLILITFSFAIVSFVYGLFDTLQGYFLRKADQNPITTEDLLYVDFSLNPTDNDYKFEGFRLAGSQNNESAEVSLFLTRATSITYYIMAGILLVRKIILWFFIILSPLWVLLLPFPLIRNTAKIWVGEFFRWILYGLLFSVLLNGLVRLWKLDIPLNFKTSTGIATRSEFTTSINILLGGPGRQGTMQDSVGNIDSYAVYVVALLMLWAVIILPFLLLKIFRDTMNVFFKEDNLLLKRAFSAIYPFMSRAPTPPGAPPSAAGLAMPLPISDRGAAMELPFTRPVGTQEVSILTDTTNIESLPQVKTTDIVKFAGVGIPTLRDLARMDIERGIPKQDQTVLKNISAPSEIKNLSERSRFSSIQQELLARSSRGDVTARTILAAAESARTGKPVAVGLGAMVTPAGRATTERFSGEKLTQHTAGGEDRERERERERESMFASTLDRSAVSEKETTALPIRLDLGLPKGERQRAERPGEIGQAIRDIHTVPTTVKETTTTKIEKPSTVDVGLGVTVGERRGVGAERGISTGIPVQTGTTTPFTTGVKTPTDTARPTTMPLAAGQPTTTAISTAIPATVTTGVKTTVTSRERAGAPAGIDITIPARERITTTEVSDIERAAREREITSTSTGIKSTASTLKTSTTAVPVETASKETIREKVTEVLKDQKVIEKEQPATGIVTGEIPTRARIETTAEGKIPQVLPLGKSTIVSTTSTIGATGVATTPVTAVSRETTKEKTTEVTTREKTEAEKGKESQERGIGIPVVTGIGVTTTKVETKDRTGAVPQILPLGKDRLTTVVSGGLPQAEVTGAQPIATATSQATAAPGATTRETTRVSEIESEKVETTREGGRAVPVVVGMRPVIGQREVTPDQQEETRPLPVVVGTRLTKEPIEGIPTSEVPEKEKGRPVVVSGGVNRLRREAPLSGEKPKVLPAVNRMQDVDLEDYEDVKKMWEDNYSKGEVPISEKIKTREAWLQQDITKIQSVIEMVSSTSDEKKRQGLTELASILPFLLLGGFSDQETVVYLKAKLEAAKKVLSELETQTSEADKIMVESKEEDEDEGQKEMEAQVEETPPQPDEKRLAQTKTEEDKKTSLRDKIEGKASEAKSVNKK